jgi:hypothetical protein
MMDRRSEQARPAREVLEDHLRKRMAGRLEKTWRSTIPKTSSC